MPNSFARLLCSVRSLFRKWTPALFFVLIGAALLYGHDALLAVTTYVNGAAAAPHISRTTRVLAALGDPKAVAIVKDATENMKGAEVLAESQASGWLPFGLVTSKELAAAGTFILLCILVWRMQRLVLPGPAKWAKNDYSQAFDALEDADKFKVYQTGRWQLIVLAGFAFLFAALCL